MLVKARFVYKGETYPTEIDFGSECPTDRISYMLEEGNYCCDCNRSLFIRRQYPDFPELDCGEEIDMVAYTVEPDLIEKRFG